MDIQNNDLEKKDFINELLDKKIDEINTGNNVYETGMVISVKDFIIKVIGLEHVFFYEKININNKAEGYVTKIDKDSVTVALLKENTKISIGDTVYRTNEEFTGKYSNYSVGRIIDIFGNDKLSDKKFDDLVSLKIEEKNIPIMDRTSVSRPFLTGIAGIDLMYPVGKGQRQLIIGDKKTGKTQICLDAIVNQKGKDVICIYVAIGKTKKEVKEIYYELAKKNALEYTIILTAFNDEKPPVIALTPYFGLSIAMQFLSLEKDVFVVIDDLKRHADAYREISLLSGKAPGRDAYPADIFYAHSRLLEKGCQHKNGGSITIMPIVETKGGDITDYISTNIISITDGQIVLSAKNFQKGQKPAINYGLSVSRLGGAVQSNLIKSIGSSVRQKLLSYLETKDVYEMANIDEMSIELQNKMREGKEISDKLKQYKYSPLTEQEIYDRFKDITEKKEVEVNND